MIINTHLFNFFSLAGGSGFKYANTNTVITVFSFSIFIYDDQLLGVVTQLELGQKTVKDAN